MPKTSPLHAFGPPRVIRNPFEGRSDTRRRRKFKEIARALPRMPGVYFFYGVDDRLLYVGKAKCLRERVRSYFAESKTARPPRLRRLLGEIKRLEWELCGSELEALLLERRLIAERWPVMNYQHKRFEIYPYLLLSDEEFPRLTVTRTEPLPGAEGDQRPDIAFSAAGASMPLETPPRAGSVPGIYLGPFTSPRVAAFTFEAVRTIYPLRSCEGPLGVDPQGRACFYFDIGRCAGPCIGAVSRERYAQICEELVQLLESGRSPQLEALRQRMDALAQEWDYEGANAIKSQLDAVEAVATRLRRLQRMREENNLLIVQPALGGEGLPSAVGLFLVRGGIVRRHLVLADWADGHKLVSRCLREVYDAPLPVADYTAKTELDEMMILDRWLKINREDSCCVWLGARSGRQWKSDTLRRVERWIAGNLITRCEQGDSNEGAPPRRETAPTRSK